MWQINPSATTGYMYMLKGNRAHRVLENMGLRMVPEYCYLIYIQEGIL